MGRSREREPLLGFFSVALPAHFKTGFIRFAAVLTTPAVPLRGNMQFLYDGTGALEVVIVNDPQLRPALKCAKLSNTTARVLIFNGADDIGLG